MEETKTSIKVKINTEDVLKGKFSETLSAINSVLNEARGGHVGWHAIQGQRGLCEGAEDKGRLREGSQGFIAGDRANIIHNNKKHKQDGRRNLVGRRVQPHIVRVL